MCVCVCTIGIGNHAAAGGLLGLLLHLFVTVVCPSPVGAAEEDEEEI